MTYIYGVDEFFEPGDIHTIIDIGGNGGYVAAKMYEVMAPNRIISLEPCIETFEDYLCETNKDIGGVLECYNIAYGDGEDSPTRGKLVEITTSFEKSFEIKAIIPGTVAPITLRMPISLVRCSAVKAARPNSPRPVITMVRIANKRERLLVMFMVENFSRSIGFRLK